MITYPSFRPLPPHLKANVHDDGETVPLFEFLGEAIDSTLEDHFDTKAKITAPEFYFYEVLDNHFRILRPWEVKFRYN